MYGIFRCYRPFRKIVIDLQQFRMFGDTGFLNFLLIIFKDIFIFIIIFKDSRNFTSPNFYHNMVLTLVRCALLKQWLVSGMNTYLTAGFISCGRAK